MKITNLVTFLFITAFLVACAPSSTTVPVSTATNTPLPSATFTPTLTHTPTLTITPTTTPTITPTPIHPTGSILIHEADLEIIYNWFSYVPRNLSKDKPVYILITGLNGGIYDYEESTRTAKQMIEERLRWPHINQFVLLVPVIPRRENPHVYPVAFDLASFKEKDDFFNRSDLKINSMIDRLTSDLINDGYQISSKVMIEGYSSGGMFAQRYSLLHPDRVKAIAGGQCGGNFSLPIDQYLEQPTNWPVGINNLTELTGITFDKNSYGNIHQLIYIGDLDTGEGGTTIVWNRLHPTWGSQYMWESVSQMEFLNIEFGESDPIRLKKEIEYLKSIGFSNIEFRLYPGVHHEMTKQMINDFMNFLVEQTKE